MLLSHDVEAEKLLLGSVLTRNELMDELLKRVRVEDFFLLAHRTIFQSMIDLHRQGSAIDSKTVADRLLAVDQLKQAGGSMRLKELAVINPDEADLANCARVIHQKAVVRALSGAATEIEEGAVTVPMDAGKNVDLVSITTLLADRFDAVENLYENPGRVTGVATGFTELDLKVAGLQPSELIILAGGASTGKTALAMAIAGNAGMSRTDKAVAVFSLEMSKEQWLARMLYSQARVDSSKVRTGHFPRSYWPRMTMAVSRLKDATVYIDDTPSLTVSNMRAGLERLVAERELSLIVIDYLQLMTGAGTGLLKQDLSDIGRSLKSMAKDLNIPILAVSQLPHEVDMRVEKRPQLSDLEAYGTLAQDADVVLLIHPGEAIELRGGEEWEPESYLKRHTELLIAKQRNGPTGTVHLEFLKHVTTFEGT